MQMIDLMKRLAELDAGNPNVVYEDPAKQNKVGVKEGWNDRLDDPDDYERFANNLDPDDYDSHDSNLDRDSEQEKWSVECQGKEYECRDKDHAMNKAGKLLNYGGKETVIKLNGKPKYTWDEGQRIKPVEQGVAEGQRLIGKKDFENRSIKIYKDTEWGEYIVKLYVDGNYQADADYHTDDKEDAIGTAQHMLSGKQGVAEGLEECGMMGSMSPAQPHTPASINMTAASGEELSAMLKDIMTLAGQSHMHEPEPLGGADGVAVVDVEPAGDGMGPPEMGATDSMRSVLDRMNDVDSKGDDDDEEDDDTDEGIEGEIPGVDNTPAPPNRKREFDANAFAYQPNSPNQGDRIDGNMPKAHPTAYESLMAEYKKFIAETKTD